MLITAPSLIVTNSGVSSFDDRVVAYPHIFLYLHTTPAMEGEGASSSLQVLYERSPEEADSSLIPTSHFSLM